MSIFNSIKVKKPRRSRFNLSHDRLLTTQIGRLTPILCQEVIPGDTFRLSTELFARLLPLQTPAMARFDIYTHFFFVPNRLIWTEWEDFITGGKDGKAKPTFPTTSYKAIKGAGDRCITPGSNLDYLGFPAFSGSNPNECNDSNHISILPFRALGLIWNEYYRDESIDEEIDIGAAGSQHYSALPSAFYPMFRPMYRRWKKDYFTSALPWPQRGADEVVTPFDLRVAYDHSPTANGETKLFKANGKRFGNGATSIQAESTVVGQESPTANLVGLSSGNSHDVLNVDNSDNLTIEGRTATINELRRSIKVQAWLEKNARGGYRYIEQILSHFGVRSSDARLQRPEYLGGGKTPIVISEIPQTSSSLDSTPQGTLVGKGTALNRNHAFKRFFEEHGIIIGIMSIIPKSIYQQGLPRLFTKFDKLEFAWPEFGNLGEQEIRSDELFYDPTALPSSNEGLFGYTPRYAEYKYAPSTVHGQFRSTLAHWHSGRIFQSRPELNADFLSVKPNQFDRLFAVSGEDTILVQLHHNIVAKRALPYYGTPTI